MSPEAADERSRGSPDASPTGTWPARPGGRRLREGDARLDGRKERWVKNHGEQVGRQGGSKVALIGSRSGLGDF